jgi:C4-dicarboxylate-binding protein DctP
MRKSGRTTIIVPTAAENEAMRKAMQPIYQEMAGRLGKAIIDDFLKETQSITN